MDLKQVPEQELDLWAAATLVLNHPNYKTQEQQLEKRQLLDTTSQKNAVLALFQPTSALIWKGWYVPPSSGNFESVSPTRLVQHSLLKQLLYQLACLTILMIVFTLNHFN